MITICPVCGAPGTAELARIPAGEPVRVVDGSDVWLRSCDSHDTASIAAALAGFQNADGEPLVVAPSKEVSA